MTIECTTTGHGYRLIAVPSQKITCQAKDVEYLEDQNKTKYSIHGFYAINKSDFHPGGLFLLATGQEIEPSDMWSHYNKSDKIILFIAKPL